MRQTSYAFVLAGRDGEDELVMSMFSEKPAETKLLLTLLTFGVTIGGSFGVCWLTGSDPWGAPCPGAWLRLLSGLRMACFAKHVRHHKRCGAWRAGSFYACNVCARFT